MLNALAAGRLMCDVKALRLSHMKKRIRLSLVSVVLLLLAYGLGYWTGVSRAPRGGPQIIFERDSSDVTSFFGDSFVNVSFDPSLAKQNAIPNKVR